MSKIVVLCLFMAFSVHSMYAQNIHTIIAGSDYTFSGVIATSDGGFAIAANKGASPCLIKLDSTGSITWSRIITNERIGVTHGVLQTKDSGYLLFGEQQYIYDGGALIKLDSSGRVQWCRFEDQAYYKKAIVTRDGGYAIIGSHFTVPDFTGARLLKLDSLGHFQWHLLIYDTVFLTHTSGVMVTESTDGYCIGGLMKNSPFLAKISPSGILVWAHTYSLKSGKGFEWSQIQKTVDNKYIIASTLLSGNQPNPLRDGILLLAIDSNGSFEWGSSIDAFAIEESTDLIIKPNGDYEMAGMIDDVASGLIFTTFDSKGALKDVRILTTSNKWYIYDPHPVLRSSDNRVIVAGSLYFPGKESIRNMYVVSIDDETCGLKSILVQSSPIEILVSSRFDTLRMFVGSSESTFTNTSLSCTQSDLCAVLSVNQRVEYSKPSITLFPNPLDSRQTLNIHPETELSSGNYFVSLRDALGKEIYYEKKYISGIEETITIQTTNLPSGIYTVELLDVNTFTSVWHGKVVKIK